MHILKHESVIIVYGKLFKTTFLGPYETVILTELTFESQRTYFGSQIFMFYMQFIFDFFV